MMQVIRLAAALVFLGYGLDAFIVDGDTETFSYLFGTIHFLASAYFFHGYIYVWVVGEPFEEE